VLIEEADVECEAHPKGVNARTAGDEEAGTHLVAVEVGQSEQARAEADRDRHLPAEHRGNRKATQA
jgi:hypothetical protein